MSAVALECHGLDVSLGGHQILSGIDCVVPTGQIVALLGGNGSGKTTLVRGLLGLIRHQCGHVRIFGIAQEEFTDWARIGYVPQRGQLHVDNATVQEIVDLGRLAQRPLFRLPSRTDRTAVAQALERVGLTPRRHDQFATLSGGQQQRALIARALASNADLLVMDEPLASLDVATQSGLASLFGQLKTEGLSMLIVLHELGPMEPLIDSSVVLQHGEMIYSGPLTQGPAVDEGHHHPASEPSQAALPAPMIEPVQGWRH